MIDRLKFIIFIITTFLSILFVIKDFHSTSAKGFFLGSFTILLTFLCILAYILDVHYVFLYPTQTALEIVSIPHKLFILPIIRTVSFC
ncbi:hypothetical protein I6G76_02220 (plasmid) [Bacillus cereus]|uniref:hypothetical protein n=1 Tax=Bacillus cereus TaxID=1396 RepID=UPI0005A31A31|nr:hypothetical protein [Bacillus cereus]AJI26372.1 putative group-specific protein [Bacillus cereus E33L]QQA19109.1 hypothetical protein I6G76_02220 [Bacillus cereus]